MKEIHKFIIKETDLPAATTTRNLTIVGDPGAKFVLYISNEDPKYYNFLTDAFETREIKFEGEISNSGVYTKNIVFPTVTDDDQYDFQLITSEAFDTRLSQSLSRNNSVYYRKSITQKGSNVTLSVSPATTTSGDFQALPAGSTLVKPANWLEMNKISFNWSIAAVDATTGNAISVTRQPLATDLKFDITRATSLPGSSTTDMYLESVDNLVIGMSVKTITGGSVAGTCLIRSIDTSAKLVGLSSAQSFLGAVNIVFQGDISNVYNSTGAVIDVASLAAELTPTEQTVFADNNGSTETTLVDSYGIRIGASFTGPEVNQRVETTVSAIDHASNIITTSSTQTFVKGSRIKFSTGQTANIKGTIDVHKMPAESLALTLDLDSILISKITA